MNTGISLTASDFELYQTLSQSDFKNMNDCLFGTIIVTGNYEWQELNAFITNLWAHHVNTHIASWKKKIQHNKWSAMPNTDEQILYAEQQTCFY